MGRVDAYDMLIHSLQETKQTGALNVLKKRDTFFHDYGKISVDHGIELGEGCFGTKVFRGKYGGREVAVKVLNSNIIKPSVAKREVTLLEKLDSHRNNVRYFAVQEIGHFIYIALELCEVNLEIEIQSKLLKISSESVLYQCTEGIAYLHEQNVIHGDLKPANILLTAGKIVKMADFGLSKELKTGASSVSIASGTGGTCDWMAPEVLEYIFDENIPKPSFKMVQFSSLLSMGLLKYFFIKQFETLFISRKNLVTYFHWDVFTFTL